MAEDRVKELLKQGIAAAKAGQNQQAFEILQRVVKIEPRNENAWLWLSSVARNDQERIFCLKQLYAINPQHELAIKGLKAFGIDPTAEPKAAAATPAPDVPLATPERLRAIQPLVEEFLAQYTPRPYTPLEIEWTKKEKQRYGEATARRIQRTAYATGGLVAIAVLALVGFLIYGFVTRDRGDAQRTIDTRGLVTAGPIYTPTITPTPTLNPNTPIPSGLFATPTPIAIAGLPRGNELIQPTPTDIYPPIQQVEIRNALPAFERGDYLVIREISTPFQSAESRACYAETYYYDAIGRAKEGGTDNLNTAEMLLEQALNFETEAGFDNTCQDSPLIKAGLCFVLYQRATASNSVRESVLNQALPICQEAHNEDERLVDAALYLADVYLALGDAASAIEVLEETRNYTFGQGVRPNLGNLKLLFKLADVEVQRGNYEGALDYIRTALYVDPLSEPALKKLVEINLLLAENASSARERRIRYGYAAVLAEEQYLSRYPGSAWGYVFVAEGRIREGNPERALDYLERVLQVADQVGVDPLAVERAQALRAEIAMMQSDWQTALQYLNVLIDNAPDNLQWREWRKDAALALKDYDTALDDLEFLTRQSPERTDWILQEMQLLSQTCQYTSAIRCNPRRVQTTLTDEFIASLDEAAAAKARLYLAEAIFAELPADEEVDVSTLQSLAETVTATLRTEQTAEAYYLLGRIYDRLGEYEKAIEAYAWVIYWAERYAYPFADEARTALEAAQEAIET
ncbi:MAG: hypothetical protein CUN55_04190 [Phototrophicales bacterium]|nr:MAG: hypothetical protein CUN55_04190 [Phototrophicales bacterium]